MINKKTNIVKRAKSLSNQFKSVFTDNTKLLFGKYQGSTVLEIKLCDNAYYNWLLTKFKFK